MDTPSVETLLLAEAARCPAMAVSDAVKLLYQRIFGGGHLVRDPEESLRRLRTEWQSCAGQPAERFEPLGNRLCRLHLGGGEAVSLETVNAVFVWSAAQVQGTTAEFEETLGVLDALCAAGRLPFSQKALRVYLADYQAAGYPPVSHSEAYRAARRPAYRVVREEARSCWPLLARLDRLLRERERVLLAIEGGSGTGKTTLAAFLAGVYGASVVHMDDFFLPVARKTPERLAEPGGNVDYERVRDEVLAPYARGETVVYRPFDCGRQAPGEPVRLGDSRLTVVEGVYSLHPALAAFYDGAVFLETPWAERERRIRARSGEAMFARFRNEWIPLEDRYFETCGVAARCDLRLPFC